MECPQKPGLGAKSNIDEFLVLMELTFGGEGEEGQTFKKLISDTCCEEHKQGNAMANEWGSTG